MPKEQGINDDIEIIEETIIEEDEINEPTPKQETPFETVERILRESKKEDDDGDEGTDGEEEEEPVSEEPEGEKPVEDEPEELEEPRGPGRPKEPDVEPPQRLTEEQREIFKKSPKKIQRAIADMFKQHEGRFTQGQERVAQAEREAAKAKQDSSDYHAMASQYLNRHPELLEQGFTGPKLYGALLAVHQRLTDPKTKTAEVLRIMQENGVTLEDLESPDQVTQQAQSNPQIEALHNELNEIKSWRNQILGHQEKQMTDSALAEIDALASQKDVAGAPVYPELQNADFWQKARPLVSAYVRPPFNMSWSDAVKESYTRIVGPVNGSNVTNQTRSPVNTRARDAAVSVRGRSAPVETSTLEEIPAEALSDPYKTVEYFRNKRRV